MLTKWVFCHIFPTRPYLHSSSRHYLYCSSYSNFHWGKCLLVILKLVNHVTCTFSLGLSNFPWLCVMWRKFTKLNPMELGLWPIFSCKSPTQTPNCPRQRSDLQDGPDTGVEWRDSPYLLTSKRSPFIERPSSLKSKLSPPSAHWRKDSLKPLWELNAPLGLCGSGLSLMQKFNPPGVSLIASFS